MLTAASFLLSNPLMIMTTRMQNVDFQDKSFLRGMQEMISKEGIKPFYCGFIPGFLGMLTQLHFVSKGIKCAENKGKEKFSLPCLFAGSLLSHPFYHIQKRV